MSLAVSLFGPLLGPSAAAAGDGPPTMFLPGQFNVSGTGAATYSIPIVAPPGTAGMAPSLSLNYSSQNGDGVVGLGWSVSGLPSITRCPRTIAQDNVHGGVNYDSDGSTGTNDRFCLDGQRLMLTAGGTHYGADGTEYRTEIEGFSKIIAHGTAGFGPAWFEVHTKSGQTIEFGNSSDSRVLVVGSSTARAWAVSKIVDLKGNYLTVTYNSDSVCNNTKRTTYGEVCPTLIAYTGNAGVSPYNSVQFLYEARPDSAPQYHAGALQQTTVRLAHVKTYAGANAVLDYQLIYNTDASATKRSRLEKVKLCDGTGANCLPETNFGWQGSRDSVSFSASLNGLAQSGIDSGSNLFPGDFNGDGLTDAIIAKFPHGSCPSGGTVYLATPAGGLSPSGDVNCFATGGLYLLDFNGDGIVDVRFAQGGDTSSIFRGDELGHFTPAGTFDADIQRGVSTDFNGDGLSDIYTKDVWYGNGSGSFTKDQSQQGHTGDQSVGIPSDFDGDGCSDILRQGSTHDLIYFCQPAVPSLPSSQVLNWDNFNLVLGDFNGDGTTDILTVSQGGTSTIWFSTGTALVSVTVSVGLTWQGQIVAGDWNGDGKTDIAQIDPVPMPPEPTTVAVYLSTGSGFIQKQTVAFSDFAGVGAVADWDSDGALDVWLERAYGGTQLLSNFFKPELMTSITNGIGATTTIAYDRLNKNDRGDPSHPFYAKEVGTGSLIGLDGPMYVVSRVDASDGLGNCAPPSDTTHCYSSNYRYAGALADRLGRGFLGFHKRIVTNEETGVVQTVTYRQDYPFVGLVGQETTTLNAVTLHSKTNSFASTNVAGTPRFVYLTSSVETGNDYDGTTAYAMPKVVTLYNSYDGSGNVGQVVVCTKMKVHPGDADPSDACDPNPANWDATYVGAKITDNTYNTADTAHWIVGRLLTATTTAEIWGSAKIRHASFDYDLDGGTPTGLMTAEHIEKSNCAYELNTAYATAVGQSGYDAFGNRTAVTMSGAGCASGDPRAIVTRTATTAYTSNGQFPLTITNAKGQSETWHYNANFGTPSDHTGPNVVATSWSYDTFGRSTMETRADGNKTRIEYLYCSGVNGGATCTPAHSAFVVKVTPLASNGTTANGAITWTYFDALGRVLAQDGEGFDGTVIRVATEYDSFGRVLRVSRPYFAGAQPLWNTNAYDLLSRVGTITGADGIVTQYAYQGLTVSATADPGTGSHKNQITTTVRNGYGQIVEVTDAKGNVTAYTYDPFGAMTSYIDTNNKVTNFTYDVRGRKISSDNPDMGQWSYVYDVLDELVSQTDAKDQVTTLAYDVIGRLTTQGEGSRTTTWLYDCPEQYQQDQCQARTTYHAIGKLTVARWTTDGGATFGYSRTHEYDWFGRPSSATIAFDGGPYTFATAYTADGRIDTVTDPNFIEKRVYNSRGYLTNLKDGATGGATLWTAGSMNASLQVTQETQGNGVVVTSAFNANTGRLTGITAGVGGGSSVANYAYTYDVLGNLATRADATQSFNESFGYDKLNRLTSYQVNSRPAVSVSYNKTGNINSRTDLGTFVYGEGNDGPQEVTSCTGCTVNGIANPTFNYDPNGSMNSGAGRSFNWTAFNMVSRIVTGTARVDFEYDAEHRKVRNQTLSNGTLVDTTVFLNDPVSGVHLEVFTPNGGAQTWRHFLVADGKIVGVRIAPASGSTIFRYFVLDHLGSVSILTDSAGGVVERLSYDAWGRRRCATPLSTGYGSDYSCEGPSASQTDVGHTGHDMLDLVGLIDMNARVYDPTLGRFLSADPVVAEPFFSQSLNRYSYVYNNPLSFTDPTGHVPMVVVTAPMYTNPVTAVIAVVAEIVAAIIGLDLFAVAVEPTLPASVTIATQSTTASATPASAGNTSAVPHVENTAVAETVSTPSIDTVVVTGSKATETGAAAYVGATAATGSSAILAAEAVPSETARLDYIDPKCGGPCDELTTIETDPTGFVTITTHMPPPPPCVNDPMCGAMVELFRDYGPGVAIGGGIFKVGKILQKLARYFPRVVKFIRACTFAIACRLAEQHPEEVINDPLLRRPEQTITRITDQPKPSSPPPPPPPSSAASLPTAPAPQESVDPLDFLDDLK